jgi:hypothetical protein
MKKENMMEDTKFDAFSARLFKEFNDVQACNLKNDRGRKLWHVAENRVTDQTTAAIEVEVAPSTSGDECRRIWQIAAEAYPGVKTTIRHVQRPAQMNMD